MKVVHPDKWVPCDGIMLEEAANTAVRCSNEHVLVIAGPGSGKNGVAGTKGGFLISNRSVQRTAKNTGDQFLRQMLHRI